MNDKLEVEGELCERTEDPAMSMVSTALANNAGPEQITQLIELVKFNDQREALRAFNRAFTAAQSEFPAIYKSKKAHNSQYAPFSEIVSGIRPVLDKHGLSFRHVVNFGDNGISVTCILAHEDGHSEETTLTAPPDTSGSKNNIQAIGSSVTYLKRYTLEAICGIVTTDDDNDAQTYGVERITEDQEADLIALIEEVGANKEAFCKHFKIRKISDLGAPAYQLAVKMLEAKR